MSDKHVATLFGRPVREYSHEALAQFIDAADEGRLAAGIVGFYFDIPQIFIDEHLEKTQEDDDERGG